MWSCGATHAPTQADRNLAPKHRTDRRIIPGFGCLVPCLNFQPGDGTRHKTSPRFVSPRHAPLKALSEELIYGAARLESCKQGFGFRQGAWILAAALFLLSENKNKVSHSGPRKIQETNTAFKTQQPGWNLWLTSTVFLHVAIHVAPHYPLCNRRDKLGILCYPTTGCWDFQQAWWTKSSGRVHARQRETDVATYGTCAPSEL